MGQRSFYCLSYVHQNCHESSPYLWSISRGDPLIEPQFWGEKNSTLSNMKVLAVVFALVALTSGFKIETKKAKLIRVAKSNQCGPDETDCPNGCCPEANWYCCADSFNCAATAADCPFVAKKASLVKLALAGAGTHSPSSVSVAPFFTPLLLENVIVVHCSSVLGGVGSF